MKDTRESTFMSIHATPLLAPPPGALDDIPIMYEDEDEGEMGESNLHRTTGEILHVCIRAHLKDDHRLQAFANMNVYYREEPKHERTRSAPYISPDVMIVAPFARLPENQVSYKIGRDGPAPLTTMEALSERTAEQRDLDDKIIICARLGVAEYILVDPPGEYLPERLLLKRLQPNGTYRDEQDADGGITSVLGFRIVLDADGKVRVINARTGWAYIRPDEADDVARLRLEEAERRRAAEEALRAAEAELHALRMQLQAQRDNSSKPAEGNDT
jgi:Uma2 family endonuclease